MLAAFERKHNITVEIVYAPQGGYIQRLSAYIEAGAASDAYIDTAFWPATATIAQPIDAININTADSFWDAETFRATKINEKIYGVNGARSVWNEADCMFYNRSLLRGLGIKTPEQYQREGAWNFDAVETILKEVHKNGYIGGFLNPEMLAAAYGADWLRMENGRLVNNSSSATLALVYQKLAEWNQKGYLAQSDGRFLSGDVGLCTGNAFGLKKTGTFSSMNLTHIGFVEMPAFDSRISAQPSGLTRFYGLCRGAENPQAAGKFLWYYLDASNYDEKNTFISNDAANFFYSLNSKASKGKSCYYLNGVQELLHSFDHISDYQYIAYDAPQICDRAHSGETVYAGRLLRHRQPYSRTKHMKKAPPVQRIGGAFFQRMSAAGAQARSSGAPSKRRDSTAVARRAMNPPLCRCHPPFRWAFGHSLLQIIPQIPNSRKGLVQLLRQPFQRGGGGRFGHAGDIGDRPSTGLTREA